MKNLTKVLSILLLLTILLMLFAGCEQNSGEYSASNGIDDKGYFEGVKAKDYVELFDYNALPVPAENRTVDQTELDAAIQQMLEDYSTQIKDRPVKDGDKVNIDYVGSVGGVEFEGGNTNLQGAFVTAGSDEYIDDFLTQIIGQMPGHTIDVNVTFPADYSESTLAGKDALFITTINYISGTVELTDAFVQENFGGNGWKTVADLTEAKRQELRLDAIKQYVQDYLTTKVTVKSVPKKLIKYQQDSMINFYQRYADEANQSLDDFLVTNSIAANKTELIANNKDTYENNARYYLVIQAIAEDLKLTLEEADIISFFTREMGSPDYAQYAEKFGMPYIKQNVICEKIISHIAEHAVMA